MDVAAFEIGFWHPFDPRGRKTPEQIIERKRSEIAMVGWTFGPFKSAGQKLWFAQTTETARRRLNSIFPGDMFTSTALPLWNEHVTPCQVPAPPGAAFFMAIDSVALARQEQQGEPLPSGPSSRKRVAPMGRFRWTLWNGFVMIAAIAVVLGIYRAFWDASATNHSLLVGAYLLVLSLVSTFSFFVGLSIPLRFACRATTVFGWSYLLCVMQAGLGLETIYDSQALAKKSVLGLALLGLCLLLAYLLAALVHNARSIGDHDVAEQQ